MIVLWNVQGINKSGKCREVSSRLIYLHPDLAVLIETRVKSNKVDAIRNKFWAGWKFCDNYLYHDNGKIWLMYDESKIKVSPIRCSSQMIHVEVLGVDGSLLYMCTGVYAMNYLADRRRLRKEI